MLGHSYRLKRLLLVNVNKSHGLPSCAVVLSKGDKRCWLQAAVQVNSICLNYSSFSGCSCATKPTDELHFLTFSPATPQVRPFECSVRNTAHSGSKQLHTPFLMSITTPICLICAPVSMSHCLLTCYPSVLGRAARSGFSPNRSNRLFCTSESGNFLVAIFPLP